MTGSNITSDSVNKGSVVSIFCLLGICFGIRTAGSTTTHISIIIIQNKLHNSTENIPIGVGGGNDDFVGVNGIG